MHNLIEDNLQQIQQLMRHYGVEKAYAFGSAVKGTMHENSDVDFIIRFPENMHFKNYSDNYFALAYALEDLLKRDVDLVAEETLENPTWYKVSIATKYRCCKHERKSPTHNFKIMDTSVIKEYLLEFIEKGDDKLVKMLYAVAKEYTEEGDYTVTSEDMQELGKRTQSRLNGTSKTYSWEEAKKITTGK